MSNEGLSTEERILEYSSLILLILSFAYTILHDVGFQISILEPYYLLIVMTLFVIGIVGVGIILKEKPKIKTTIGNPIFANLIIHFSNRDDTPDTPHPHNPRYVSYKTQAYWIDDEMELHVRQHEIARWNSYDGEKKLRKSLDAQGITINDKNPSPEDLGLWRTPFGTLMFKYDPLDSETISKFKTLKLNGKFENLQIAFIFPRSLKKREYPDKTLLVDWHQHIARPAPASLTQLLREQVLGWDIFTKYLPYESLWLWSLFKRLKFDRKPLTESELLGEN